MNVNHLKYPVVVISKRDIFCNFASKYLQIRRETEISDGRLIGARIVDSEGRLFTIKSVTGTRNANLLPSFLVSREKRKIEIELEISEDGQLSIDEFRVLIVDAMRAIDAASGYAAFEGSGVLRATKGSETCREIIDTLATEGLAGKLDSPTDCVMDRHRQKIDTDTDLKYPVVFTNRGRSLGYPSPDILQSCKESLVDGGRISGGVIADSDGRQFIIKSIAKIGNLNWLPWFLVPRRWRVVKVEYELSEIERLTVGELKLLIIDVEKNYANVIVTEDEFRARNFDLKMLKGSETYREVIESAPSHSC